MSEHKHCNGTWSFVDIETGAFTGRRFSGPAHALEANTPEGCRAVEGALQLEARDDPELRRSRIVERIEALERRQQRPLRELQIDPTNAEARSRLEQIESEIEQLRTYL
jgi:hypothetical protein